MKPLPLLLAGLVPIAAFAAVAVLAADPPAASPSGAPAKRPTFAELFGDDVIARGQAVEVRRSQLENAYVAFRANLASRGQDIPEAQRTLREAQLLERLIVTQLLARRATDEDRKEARTLAAKFMEESRKGAAGEETFQRQLKAMGMTPDQFQKRVDEQSLAEAVIAREIKNKIQISDTEIRDFYDQGIDVVVKLLQADLEKAAKNINSSTADVTRLKARIELVRKENLARMEVPERVRVQHVFFAGRDIRTERELTAEQLKVARQRAEKVRERARMGEDFAKLIQENTEDRAAPETKGEYTLTREDRFSEEFKSAAFSLGPGQVSDVVSTPFGFHVIKQLERLPATKVEFDKASKDVKEFLLQQRSQQAMPDYFARLRKEGNVEILDAKYRTDLPPTVDPTKPE